MWIFSIFKHFSIPSINLFRKILLEIIKFRCTFFDFCPFIFCKNLPFFQNFTSSFSIFRKFNILSKFYQFCEISFHFCKLNSKVKWCKNFFWKRLILFVNFKLLLLETLTIVKWCMQLKLLYFFKTLQEEIFQFGSFQ